MASYDNLTAEQPWHYFHPGFSNSWISDLLFTTETETETLTKSLQISIAGDDFPAEIADSMFVRPDLTPPLHTPTVSGVSETDSPVSRQSIPPRGRVSKKRKSRASKRAATTTFIAADPANFRRMVQQVTGVRFAGGGGEVVEAEPYRGVNLPTLESSSFFVDGAAAAASMVAQPSAVVAGGGAAAAERCFDSFCSFPTLESWRAI